MQAVAICDEAGAVAQVHERILVRSICMPDMWCSSPICERSAFIDLL